MRPDALPQETAFLVYKTTLGRAFVNSEESRDYSPPLEGPISILAMEGPMPPWNVACRQDFRSIELTWTNSEVYEGPEITRNGVTVANLGGSETGWVDSAPPVGRLTYRVSAQGGGHSSYGVVCSLDHSGPRLGAPEEVVAVDHGSSIELAWRTHENYDSVLVFRNGQFHTEIPAMPQTYTDSDPSEETAVYGVVGTREGFESPATNDRGAVLLYSGGENCLVDGFEYHGEIERGLPGATCAPRGQADRRSSITAVWIRSMAYSISSGVLKRPSEKRMLPWISWSSRPRAPRT